MDVPMLGASRKDIAQASSRVADGRRSFKGSVLVWAKLELDQFEQKISDAVLTARQGTQSLKRRHEKRRCMQHANVLGQRMCIFGRNQDKPSVDRPLRAGCVE